MMVELRWMATFLILDLQLTTNPSRMVSVVSMEEETTSRQKKK